MECAMPHGFLRSGNFHGVCVICGLARKEKPRHYTRSDLFEKLSPLIMSIEQVGTGAIKAVMTDKYLCKFSNRHIWPRAVIGLTPSITNFVNFNIV